MRAAEQAGRPYLIGIAGPSGSGKTELSRRLAAILPAEIVAVDAYNRELAHLPFKERERRNFDAPEAIDQDLLAAQLALLAGGGEVAARSTTSPATPGPPRSTASARANS